MYAVVYEAFGAPPELRRVPDPTPETHGVVVAVRATGLCRSDWHGWVGHDPGIQLPHVPGHELAGVVAAVGRDVTRWRVGDRVTVPFVGGCGTCPQCQSGHQQVCDAQFQPGFTHWGSFAEFVSIHRADLNVVRLPEALGFATAASLGCRFVTAFRAVVDQGRVSAGQWVAVYGCGGVGLSAVMIARAVGARVVAVDLSDEALALATQGGAIATVNARHVPDVVEAVVELTGGGAHVSLDALGHPETCVQSIRSLRKRGRHVQVGLLVADQRAPAIPMDRVVADELEIVGSHGMQAHRYDAMLAMIEAGTLAPDRLVGRTITLEASIPALMRMDTFESAGVTVITDFGRSAPGAQSPDSAAAASALVPPSRGLT
ncbi:zinc-dependent alcohol dehydrogenase family protein [Rubrivirga sp. IMCC43871]|uniref:zinc-dependent alcohol dehydrogenase family protein n=1 Tax=Rubrivirga sp. IMCC43871 TaxID=3391575 RepID=UPI0039900831